MKRIAMFIALGATLAALAGCGSSSPPMSGPSAQEIAGRVAASPGGCAKVLAMEQTLGQKKAEAVFGPTYEAEFAKRGWDVSVSDLQRGDRGLLGGVKNRPRSKHFAHAPPTDDEADDEAMAMPKEAKVG